MDTGLDREEIWGVSLRRPSPDDTLILDPHPHPSPPSLASTKATHSTAESLHRAPKAATSPSVMQGRMLTRLVPWRQPVPGRSTMPVPAPLAHPTLLPARLVSTGARTDADAESAEAVREAAPVPERGKAAANVLKGAKFSSAVLLVAICVTAVAYRLDPSYGAREKLALVAKDLYKARLSQSALGARTDAAAPASQARGARLAQGSELRANVVAFSASNRVCPTCGRS
jgi:hypothetical protein